MSSTVQTPSDIFRTYLIPYLLLLTLYLLIIGGGGSWLYFSARNAQTELVTTHIFEVIKPTVSLLEEEQLKGAKPDSFSKLSEKVVNLYTMLPHLRQISIRDRKKGHGVKLNSNKQLVEVDLEPLTSKPVKSPNLQALAHQLHHKIGPLFHVYFDIIAADNQLVQVDIAFDRVGLMEQIETSMQSLIHNIFIFSVLGLISLLFAIQLSIHIGRATLKMGARMQSLNQQVAMGELSAHLVHDLRNPLASIRANIKNLLITPEQTNEVVTELDQDLMRLEHKLSDFLKLTNPRNGPFTVVDIDELLLNVVKQCQPLFKEKNQTLTQNIAPGIPKISVMTESLSDALVNLLVNARDHAPEKGNISLQVHEFGKFIKIVIDDDGPGIDDDNLPHIFEPFYTTRTGGHGLGLAIVMRIISAHNGTVSALNRPEGGARFVITLPLKPNHE